MELGFLKWKISNIKFEGACSASLHRTDFSKLKYKDHILSHKSKISYILLLYDKPRLYYLKIFDQICYQTLLPEQSLFHERLPDLFTRKSLPEMLPEQKLPVTRVTRNFADVNLMLLTGKFCFCLLIMR